VARRRALWVWAPTGAWPPKRLVRLQGPATGHDADAKEKVEFTRGNRSVLVRDPGAGILRETDLASGKQTTRDRVATFALSGDGGRLAIGEVDRPTTIWDTAARARVNELDDIRIAQLAWAGEKIVSLNAAGASTWDVSPRDVRRRACAIADRTLTRAEWRALVGADRPYTRLCLPPG
jgi:hypothetical protein